MSGREAVDGSAAVPGARPLPDGVAGDAVATAKPSAAASDTRSILTDDHWSGKRDMRALLTVIARARIDSIVMVDDEIPDVARLESGINGLPVLPTTLASHMTPEAWPADPKQRFRVVCDMLDSQTFDERHALLKQLYSELNRSDEYQGGGQLPLLLEDLDTQVSSLRVIGIGPREWDKHGPTPGGEPDAAGVPLGASALVLFDLDLSKANRSKTAGLDLARKYVDGFAGAICGIISRSFDKGHRSSSASVLLPTAPERDRYVLAAKETLSDDPAQFAFQIARAVTAPSAENLRKLTTDTIRLAQANAMQRVENLDLDILLYAVVHRSAEEGIGGFETLCRLFQTEFGDALLQAEVTNSQLQEILHKLRDVVPEWRWSVPSVVYDAQHRELYTDPGLLNKALVPIQLGDLFALKGPADTKEKEYVLVMQPCDLTIRESGRREVRGKESEVSTAVLLGVRKKTAEHGGFELPASKNPGPDGKRGNKFVDFRPEVYVPLDILDLCAYSGIGNATITPNPDHVSRQDVALLPTSLRERYTILENGARRVLANPEPSAASDRTTLHDKMVLQVPVGASTTVRGVVENGTLKYECRRVGRLNFSLATDLLLEFKRYSSRTAHAMDLLGRLVNDAGTDEAS